MKKFFLEVTIPVIIACACAAYAGYTKGKRDAVNDMLIAIEHYKAEQDSTNHQK